MSVFYLSIYFAILIVLHQIDAQDDFLDVVRQKTRGNQIQQCPCVIHPESRQCVSYDSRYVAVNAEEAILSFLDLSKHHSGPAPLINSNTFSCTSDECRNCYALLYHKLSDIGFVSQSYRSAIDVLPFNQIQSNLCRRFNFPIPLPTILPPSVVPNYLQSLISAGRQFRSLRSSSVLSNGRRVNGNTNINGAGGRGRNGNGNGNGVGGQTRTNSQQSRGNTPRQQPPRVNQNQQFQQRPIQRFQQQQQPQFQQQQQSQQVPQFQQQSRFNGRFWEPISRQSVQNTFNQWQQQQQPNNFQQQQQWVPQQQWQPQPQPQPQSVWSGGGGFNGVGNGGFGGGGGGGFGGGFFGGSGGPSQQHFGGGFGGFRGRRNKRAAVDVIGTRFLISCTDRGESEDEMLALCGSCWTWRKLPDNYFPKIINELSCKEDDFCLSGWGECVQQYRNVDVLRKEGGRWIPTVITTATCCDCRVRAGTEIHSLIIGDKK